MDLGWKLLIPLSLGWLLVLAALDIGNDRDWNPILVGVISVAGLAVAWGLLQLAINAGRQKRLAGEVID